MSPARPSGASGSILRIRPDVLRQPTAGTERRRTRPPCRACDRRRSASSKIAPALAARVLGESPDNHCPPNVTDPAGKHRVQPGCYQTTGSSDRGVRVRSARRAGAILPATAPDLEKRVEDPLAGSEHRVRPRRSCEVRNCVSKNLTQQPRGPLFKRQEVRVGLPRRGTEPCVNSFPARKTWFAGMVAPSVGAGTSIDSMPVKNRIISHSLTPLASQTWLSHLSGAPATCCWSTPPGACSW